MAAEGLDGKVVLVAGGSGGIGTATAIALAKAGAAVVLSGRDARRLENVAAQVEYAAGAECATVAADLTDPAQVNAAVDAAAARGNGGALDAVVNAAGVGAIKPVESLTPDDFDAVLRVNLYGAMLLSQAAVRVMAPRKRGHLLHVVGILGKAPMANATAYCASKYGLVGFLAALRAEVARRHSLRITGLFLGGVDTPFWDNPAIEMKVQRDRMLRPEDAAGAILFALTQPEHLVLSDLTLQPESHQL
jgi:NAD(P)-dependent dehydrogenase (short-subunit alcohol dehydrogenase family)